MALIDRIHQAIFAGIPKGRPLVTLSYAQSIDGSITARRGQPLALSGPEAMQLTHQLRSAHHGILVGVGTVLADDPELTVRLVPGPTPQPIVLDSTLRSPATCRLLEAGRRTPMWVFTTHEADPVRQKVFEAAGARVFRAEEGPDRHVDLRDLLRQLSHLGIEHLMVEGGAQVITAFLKAQLVDNVVLTIAPLLVGGLRAVEQPLSLNIDPRNSGDAGPLQNYPRLGGMRVAQLGEDLIIWGKVQWMR